MEWVFRLSAAFPVRLERAHFRMRRQYALYHHDRYYYCTQNIKGFRLTLRDNYSKKNSGGVHNNELGLLIDTQVIDKEKG